MKRFKKLLAVLITAAMVLSMSLAAFAAGPTPDPEPTGKTITLSGGKSGHTYTLYQIFTGNTTETDNELVNIQWGTDAPAALKSAYDTAAAAAKALEGQDARAFAQGLGLTGTGSKQVTLSEDGNVVFSGLDEGYYVILDSNNNATPVEGDYSSAIVVKVVADVTGELKGEAPSSSKKVKDTNDSDANHTGDIYADSADYDIGDAVPFQLKATTAGNVNTYKKYHVTFQDKQSAGLDTPTEFKVTVLGKEFTLGNTEPTAQTTTNGTKITVTRGTTDANQTFAITVTFEPATAGDYLHSECNSTDIVVDYTATLNTSAVVGKAGNPNESYIKYSNNPENFDDKEEGKTPTDKVIVFTYKMDIDKVDETGAALKGANFTLYKQVNEGDTGAVKGSDLTFGDSVEHSKISSDKYYVVVGNKTGDATGSTFDFKGIDDGTYVLVETTVPAGYNAYNSAEIAVSATHFDGDEPALNTLTASAPFKANVEAGEIDKTDETKHNAVSGELYAEIVNNSGATMPSTGGIGTTIFYVVGTILVIGAGVVLITRRRMSA